MLIRSSIFINLPPDNAVEIASEAMTEDADDKISEMEAEAADKLSLALAKRLLSEAVASAADNVLDSSAVGVALASVALGVAKS